MNFLLEKLLFRDINAAPAQDMQRVRTIKAVAIAAMLVVLITGTILTALHAYAYYNTIKTAFLAEPDPIEELGEFDPTAVWFTGQTGDPYQIQGILVYLIEYKDGRLVLDIVNVNDMPVELVSVHDLYGETIYPFQANTRLEPDDDYLPQRFIFNDVDERMLAVRSEIIVNYRYDDGIERQAFVIPFRKYNDAVFSDTTLRLTDNTNAFEFISQDANAITFDGKRISISEPLFIPQGRPLRLSAGQEIDLINGAYIVSRAPIQIEGSAESPVQIGSSDGSGRGLLVLKAQSESILQHVIFDGLDAPHSGIWGLTGSVTFYESDVHISHSAFLNNPSEDGLNIIRSTFTIDSSTFENTASDAFDTDFCQGTISNSTFENTANDAIDVSGTTIEIRDVQTKNIGDKGISAGENSKVNLRGVSIDQAVVGIASKDLSHVSGGDIVISNTRIALTLYIKKAEFGPGRITLENVHTSGDIDLEYLIQPGSTLILDGRTIQPRSATKETLLFEKMINGEPIQ